MPLSRSLPAVMPRSPSSVRRLSDSAGIAVAGGGGLAMPSRADAAFREYDMTVLPRSSIGLVLAAALAASPARSEEHTSELQSLMRISYAVFCLKKKNKKTSTLQKHHTEHSLGAI